MRRAILSRARCRLQRSGAGAAFLALGLGAAIMAAAGSLPDAWRNWRYSRAVILPAASAMPADGGLKTPPSAPPDNALVGVVVPPEIYSHAVAGLRDLRVIDAQGREVPYVLDVRRGSTHVEARPTKMGKRSFSPGHFTQVVLDAGEKPLFHNAVYLDTPETEFIVWVEAAVSDDARHWRIVRDRAPIFRFEKEGRQGSTTITYDQTNARYLRLRLFEARQAFPVSRAEVRYAVSEAAETVLTPLVVNPGTPSQPQRSAWVTDVGSAGWPIAEIRFEVEQPEFHRPVHASSSQDGSSWTVYGTGEIYRFRQGNTQQESLRIGLSEWDSQRYWRVEVLNGNDAPLVGARPAFYLAPRHVVFRREPGNTYRLIYGDSTAKPPQYDLARLYDGKVIHAAAPAELGPEEVNSSYADPRPFTERHPVLLWIALGLAIVLLGLSALRALKSST